MFAWWFICRRCLCVGGAKTHPVRCPCPFTNTLANHGYIPRNGLNVSGDVVLAAFDEVFNIDQSFTIGPVTNALSVSTTGINGTFNLPDVNIHNCMHTQFPPFNIRSNPRRIVKKAKYKGRPDC